MDYEAIKKALTDLRDGLEQRFETLKAEVIAKTPQVEASAHDLLSRVEAVEARLGELETQIANGIASAISNVAKQIASPPVNEHGEPSTETPAPKTHNEHGEAIVPPAEEDKQGALPLTD